MFFFCFRFFAIGLGGVGARHGSQTQSSQVWLTTVVLPCVPSSSLRETEICCKRPFGIQKDSNFFSAPGFGLNSQPDVRPRRKRGRCLAGGFNRGFREGPGAFLMPDLGRSHGGLHLLSLLVVHWLQQSAGDLSWILFPQQKRHA